jgi:hypothetical protein
MRQLQRGRSPPRAARRILLRKGHAAIDHIGYRFTARIDLADCLLREALTDLHVHSTIAVATPSAHPSMLKLIWQEGIRKKA